MKPLSKSAVARCETARTKRCRCRCHGLAHGISRASFDARLASLILVSDAPDPHHDAEQRALPFGRPS